MNKSYEPELNDELETVFDCCSGMRLTFHPDLKQQLLDGLNAAQNSTSVPGYLELWLTAKDDNSLIDAVYSWNPKLQAKFPRQIADLKLSMGPQQPLGSKQPCGVLLAGAAQVDTTIPAPPKSMLAPLSVRAATKKAATKKSATRKS